MAELTMSVAMRDDPRFAMYVALPRAFQPLVTWITAKPAPGESVRERSPAHFVAVALAQTVGGALLCAAPPTHWAPAWLVIALGLLIASSGMGLFQVVIFHHCSHGTVFRNRAMNDFVGNAVSSILLFSHFDVYKRGHMLHHNTNKLLTHEDEFAEFVFGTCRLEASVSKRELWRRVLVSLVSPAFHARFLRRRVQAAWGSHDAAHNALGMGVWAALLMLAILTGHVPGLLIGWVLPVTVLLQIGTVFRILCEHRFPDPELIALRGRDFACHASAATFPGVQPPRARATTLRGLWLWTVWWAQMLTVQLFVRVFVLVGDAPCHDYHHRRPASRRWTSYIQARQHDLEAGSPGFRADYSEVWGLFRSIDQTLDSLSRTPAGIVW